MCNNPMPHRSLQLISRHNVERCMKLALQVFYSDKKIPAKRIFFGTESKPERNKRISEMYSEGYSLSEIGKIFAISPQRASQIIKKYSK